MITVDEALERLFALASPIDSEEVELRDAAGRVLRKDAVATRAQPPFASSSMDGYALHSSDAKSGAVLEVIGEAAAGHGFSGNVGSGQAVRIFTGAPLPKGTDHVEIQEDVTRTGEKITLNDPAPPGANVRALGSDFKIGDRVGAPCRLGPADIALLASMNVPKIDVSRRPEVALIATGDELVMPGEAPSEDQIIASNSLGLEAMLSQAGASPRVLPIARDTPESLISAFRFARGADLIVTIGGASVGDHDLVRQVAGLEGLEQAFYKVAMRPGKPLMAGRLDGTPIVGLPGNPVSSMVCGCVFLVPMINVMLGLGAAPAPRRTAPLAHDLADGGPREHYMRASIEGGALRIFERQDSSLLSVLSQAEALAIQPAGSRARRKGDVIEYLALDPTA